MANRHRNHANQSDPHVAWCYALLVAIVLLFFWDVLFLPGQRVLSAPGMDLESEFIHSRQFAVREIRQGNLPLWNPHIFSGMPFSSGFQSALFYPPNALFLLLPMAKAVNWSIALHLILCGALMLGWLRHRGLHPAAALVGAFLIVFGGTQFPHVFAGHLSNLCTMAWAPLILWCIDAFCRDQRPRWVLLGMLGVTMQVLAGHPQYVLYTAISAGLFCLLSLRTAKRRIRLVLGFTAMFAGAAALSAIQLLPGILATSQSIRGQGVPPWFAGMFSFPPENILTLLAPGFFGGVGGTPYWGRFYIWEMCSYMGVTVIITAIVALAAKETRDRLKLIAISCILLILALGAYTPLFFPLYHFAPMLGSFRGWSKFIFFFSLFLTVLAASGYDILLKERPKPGVLWLTAFLILISCGGALVLEQWARTPHTTETAWTRCLQNLAATGESYVLASNPAVLRDFHQQTAFQASSALFRAAVISAAAFACLFVLRYRKQAAYGLLALALIEILWFAKGFRATMDLARVGNSALHRYHVQRPGDYRSLNMYTPNTAMSTGSSDIWGRDPSVNRRYIEFLAYLHDINQREALDYEIMDIRHPHPLLGQLRCGVMLTRDGRLKALANENHRLERLTIVSDVQIKTGRDAILKAITAPGFNPRTAVILESPPTPLPDSTPPNGRAHIVAETTDTLDIEATVDRPCILVIADAYAPGWNATALRQSDQQHYAVMPANYVLRALPLNAGNHRLRLQYVPLGFIAGRWISALAWIGYAAAVVVVCRSRSSGRAG